MITCVPIATECTKLLMLKGTSDVRHEGYLFYRAIQSANKESERVDKADGY